MNTLKDNEILRMLKITGGFIVYSQFLRIDQALMLKIYFKLAFAWRKRFAPDIAAFFLGKTQFRQHRLEIASVYHDVFAFILL